MSPRARSLAHVFPLLLAAAAWAPAGPAHAQAAGDAIALSFDAARARMRERSDKLAAARAAVESKELQREGLKGLGGPVVSVSGLAYAYNANLNLDLDPLNQRIGRIGQALPSSLQGLVARVPIPQLPNSYTLNRHDSGVNASVSAVWPLYMGGASEAVRGFVSAQAREAEADADQASHEVETVLVQRYFGAQLAQRAAVLRAQAERTIAQHDAAAQKMLAAGVISRVERLQASATYEEARRNARKAEDDAALAAVALARTVRAEGTVVPQTPLFVSSQPVEPLAYFIDAALVRHPGLGKVAAKTMQAEQLHEGEEALRRPQVIAFGTRQLKSGNADWVAGLGVRWTLYDAVDRDALAASSLKQVEQAERTGAQARSDISLLVERNWRALENARRHYLGMQAAIDLAEEVRRLRVAGLREGTSTTLDLIDAETNHAKVLTERAQAANDYVQALAQLLESAGLSEKFSDYMARADLRVNDR
ncbi:outer membrane protein TolC [Variovorax sp. TBS-050B]|uniref:TolC family protein n=1 Tax=Variovorax sp. TBS-050B TaxID=2940551 RepID=UPI0024757BED|nr:TolC family protein [Variovorax sp. TBS-050B]MDH6590637.1 outer membrane protein TolC [Variovorax sp. TBS-050B]